MTISLLVIDKVVILQTYDCRPKINNKSSNKSSVLSLFLVSIAGCAATADQGRRLLVLRDQSGGVRGGVDGCQRGGGQAGPGDRPGVDPAGGHGGLVGQRQDLTHHVHVVRYQQRHLQDLRLRRLEEELLGLRRLRDGDDEHEVVLAAAEGDDVGVGELLGDLHGGVVQHGHALLVDGQPDQALVNLTLNSQQFYTKNSSSVCPP